MRIARFSAFGWLGIAAAIGSALLQAGCAARSKPAVVDASGRQPSIVVGEVALVDEKRGFVLVDLESNLYVPAPGRALRSISASSGETAHLRASAEQKRPFIAADILDGDPAVGDVVVQ
jgi:hypothetical protein